LDQNVISAIDGQDGVDKFRNNNIDLIITDINMPHKNGFEMIKEIREIEPDIPAIIISAYNPKDFFIDDLNSIAILNDFIPKPFKLKELIEKINSNISKIEKRVNYKNTYQLLEQYKKALDSSTIVSKTDINGIITYANDKFCEISGYSKDELIGSNHSIIKSPNMPKSIFKEMWSTITSKQVWKGEIENRAKDGEPYFLDTTILPILDNKNNIIEYMGIRFDITEHKLSLTKAHEAEKIKSRFLANMSHEIRTPINGIIGFLDILNHTELSGEQKEYVEIIKNSSSTLLSIINDILDFSKIEENQLDVESIDMELSKEINSLIKLFDMKAKEKNINFIFEYDKNIPQYIKLDPLRIKQILTNLVNNSIKFTDNGGVKLKIKLQKDYGEQCTILFVVLDDGIGIPKDKQKTILEPFLQSDVSISRKYGGTGLGLTITKELVKLLGGKLKLKSKEGVGSKFYFALKVKKAKNCICCIEDIDRDFDTKNNNLNILVAEDNKTNQLLMQHLLKSYQYKITSNGSECLEEYKTNPNLYDLILMDINMPILDGVKTVQQILDFEKQNSISHIPIIALTANAIKGDKEKFLSSGFDDYLSKPIDKNQLKEKIYKYNNIDRENTQIKVKNNNNLSKENFKYNKIEVAKQMELPIEFLDQLIEMFFSTVDDDLKKLKTAILSDDFNTIVEVSHGIKGASINIKMDDIYKITQDLEENAISKNSIDYNELYNQLEELLNRYKKEVF
jgi:PAS domain S-box-containing protein